MADIRDLGVYINNPFSRIPGSRLRSKPKRVERARIKHQLKTNKRSLSDTETKEPSLLDKFLSLPSELRAHIYRLLLVQPCKWDMRHFRSHTCNPVNFDYPGPRVTWFPFWSDCSYVCAECHSSSALWRNGSPVLVSPLRSIWAPEQTNPFLCDNCYSDRVRAKRELHPTLKLVKCLCVRRENLHILLINKQFYEEAGRVFWTENTFAFEKPGMLGDFLESIHPQTRDLITKISLVADAEGGSFEPLRSKDVLRAMYWLRQCRGLTKLELDEHLLSRLSWTLKVKNVMPKTQVRFIHYEELSRGEFLGNLYPPVYKILYRRRDSEDPVAERLAASMVRQRPLTNKDVKALFRRFRGPDGEVL